MSNALFKAELPRLCHASLELDPVARLREAAENVFYVLTDIGGQHARTDENRRYNEATPVHEAGHAISFTLAGRRVLEISFKPLGSRGHLGNCRVEGDGHINALTLSKTIGRYGMAREVVGCFAGPVAELRFDPRRVFSGLESDRRSVDALCA